MDDTIRRALLTKKKKRYVLSRENAINKAYYLFIGITKICQKRRLPINSVLFLARRTFHAEFFIYDMYGYTFE